MIEITEGQLEAWVAAYFWPFVRVAAFMTVAPVFGARFVPARIRIVLAAAITLLVVPLLPLELQDKLQAPKLTGPFGEIVANSYMPPAAPKVAATTP